MSSHLPFPLADFYDALVSKHPKSKLQPFLAQFRKKNTYVVYESINRLIQILTNKSQLPIMKFNALMATRYFFDTCDYSAITFIEIFMLPLIYEIAVEKYLKRSQQGIELYFVDRGAQNTKQMRRLGLNYVELASQLIFNCAKVKPYRLVENKQLKEQSNFVRTTKVLNSKGISEPEKCIYYIPSYPAQTRKKFIKKLKHLSPQPYISFLISQYLEQINLNKKCDLDIKKLLLFGDSFLTSTIVEIIEQQLSKMSQNFINKKKYLNLLNDLVRSGQIQSIYLVNSTDFIRQIADQIMKVKGNGTPEQGEYIYPKIQASKQQKKQFYLQFLRVIEILAHCMPLTDEGEESDVFKIYEEMKRKNFQFPKNVILNKIKKQMEQNLLMNQERNQTLMRLIDEDDRASSRNVGSYVSSKGEFKFHFPDYKEKTSYLQLDELQYKVFETKKKIARLSVSKEELSENIDSIGNFAKNWQDDLENLDIEDQDPHQLQILVDQGDLCCAQFQKVLPIYEQYKKGKLNYDQFCKKIQFLEHEDHESEEDGKSQAFQNHKTISQPKSSNITHSVRKHIQEEYVSKYGYEYQKEEKSISVKSKNTKMEEKSVSMKNARTNQQVRNSPKKQQKNEISQPESVNNSMASSKHNLRKQDNQKNYPIMTEQSDTSQKRRIEPHEFQARNQRFGYQNSKVPQPRGDNIIPTTTQLGYSSTKPKKLSKIQKFQRQEPSQISSSEQENQLHQNRHPQPLGYANHSQRGASPIDFGSSQGDYRQSQQHQPSKFKPQQYEKHQRKSYINHSVISKSSYHSQPTQLKNGQSQLHQGNSVMNDYEYENVPQPINGNLKKSSIKRTQNSALKGSSHKKIPEPATKLPQNVSDAVSPFKKKKSSLSRQAKIKDSYIKEFQFVKQNKKPQSNKIGEQATYDDVFRRKNQFDMSRNASEISSQSESVLQKRTNKIMKQDALRETARVNINDPSEYFIESKNSSVLKRSSESRFKQSSKTPSKNFIMFDSKQASPKKAAAVQKMHQDYEIKYNNETKTKNLIEKMSEFSKNTSKLGSGIKIKSGIKLISKNDHKSFDSLYKNEYNNLYGENGNAHQRYQEVTSEYNHISPARGYVTQKPQVASYSPREKSSFIENQDCSPVSLQQVNEQLQKYKDKMRNLTNNEASQIHEPQNMPMLYSYCSQKSIHSKMTDSHTRNGTSSNYNDFRACFLNMDKEVLPLNLTKSKAVSSSFSLDKAKNFIDIRCSNVRSSSKVNTVADAISEKNAKNSILLYKLEREKQRLVENLQHKIKELEVNGKMMKTKYALKDQSMKETLESRQNSQRELKLNYPETINSRQSNKQNISSYEQLRKSKMPLTDTSSPAKVPHEGLNAFTSNKSLINVKNYDQFFEGFSRVGVKKSLYKKKGLLTKNDEIEIGYMITRKEKYCLISVFVTPFVSSIKNVQMEVECDHNLTVKTKPSRIEVIDARKQQILICSFTVQNIPFILPVAKLSFDQNKNYKKNVYNIGLPCSILAFSEMTNDFSLAQESEKESYRTDIFRVNKKINKADKLKEIFGSFSEVKRENKTSRLEGLVRYQNHGFRVNIVVNDGGYGMIYGESIERQSGSGKFLEYVLATLRFQLSEDQNQA